jgi:hypothetical protein
MEGLLQLRSSREIARLRNIDHEALRVR